MCGVWRRRREAASVAIVPERAILITRVVRCDREERSRLLPAGESILRRVQGERAVGLLYGQRALLIGALDARNYVGTAEHSRYRDHPVQAAVGDAKMFETIFFGTRAEADKVLAVVHRMHRRSRVS